eukprot:12464_5
MKSCTNGFRTLIRLTVWTHPLSSTFASTAFSSRTDKKKGGKKSVPPARLNDWTRFSHFSSTCAYKSFGLASACGLV